MFVGENDPKCPPPVEENCQKFDPETHVPPPPPGSPSEYIWTTCKAKGDIILDILKNSPVDEH